MSDIEVQQMEENILRGVALAYERLVEQKKKEDGELVFAREDGKIVKVKAKDLQQRLISNVPRPEQAGVSFLRRDGGTDRFTVNRTSE